MGDSSQIIRHFPESEISTVALRDETAYMKVLDLRSLDEALDLAAKDIKIFLYLQTESGLSTLQNTLELHNEWRKISPYALPKTKSLEDYIHVYNKNYTNVGMFVENEKWLRLVFQYKDYDTLAQIIRTYKHKLSEEEVVFIREHMKAYPLTVFFSIWEDLGKLNDLIAILEYQNLTLTEKGNYTLPILKDLPLTSEEHLKLLRTALRTLPNLFRLLFRRDPKLGMQVLSEDVHVPKGMDLSQLRLIAKSIRHVLPKDEAESSIFKFAKRLVLERMNSDYTYKEREIAWNFFMDHKQYDMDFLDKLKAKIRPDNSLWLNAKLKSF